MNQWKNTKSVLAWFNSIPNKNQYSFIAFDVENFYPSISIELLNAALDFASNYDDITEESKSEKLSYTLKHRVNYTTQETIGVKEHRPISSNRSPR